MFLETKILILINFCFKKNPRIVYEKKKGRHKRKETKPKVTMFLETGISTLNNFFPCYMKPRLIYESHNDDTKTNE